VHNLLLFFFLKLNKAIIFKLTLSYKIEDIYTHDKILIFRSTSGIGPAYEVIDLTQESIESDTPLTRTKRVRSHRSRTIGGSGNRKKNKNKVRLAFLI